LIEQRKLKVHQVKYLVCDEVDDLLKADSLPLFTDLIKRLPTHRQNIAFGATITQDSLTKAKELLAIDQVIDLRQDLSSQANLHHGYLFTPVRKRVD
ncbi:DEAD/DEAH box helicase, partial [Actinotignum schaalii]|nr:DEAD/DEAH box helicase [Actinotignum schaalii]